MKSLTRHSPSNGIGARAMRLMIRRMKKAMVRPTAHQPSRVVGHFKKRELELAILDISVLVHREKFLSEA
jgi:hypothetical protein